MSRHRGRMIAKHIALLLSEMPDPAYPFSARYSRLPRITKDDLGTDSADVTIAPLTKIGDDQDHETERLNYGISVGVTAGLTGETGPGGKPIQPAESSVADRVEDLIEQIQDYLSATSRFCLEIVTDAETYEAELELPFVNDPVYNLELMRETGIYQSITVFNYLTEKNRNE